MNKLKRFAQEVALLTLEISYKGRVGHIGSALSISDILSVLYLKHLKISKKNLNSEKRDRFILSKGHAVASLYAALHKKGILSKKEIDSFGKDYGLCEHPEIKDPGIEMTTGSLGHGLAFGIGIALGQKKNKLKNKTFVLISDGESDEGSIWEAALLAPNLNLDNLTVIVDYNKWQCFGPVSQVVNLEPFSDKWKSFGWEVKEIDGHDLEQIDETFSLLPFSKKRPSVILAHTVSGKGIKQIENQLVGHYKVFNEEEYLNVRKEIENL